MTPKEKAFQLVDRYLDINEEQEFNTPRYLTKEEAVEGALIAVNEIIESRKDDGSFNDTIWGHDSEYYSLHPMYLTYWLEVKKEINNI
jgi:hypothetical protein